MGYLFVCLFGCFFVSLVVWLLNGSARSMGTAFGFGAQVQAGYSAVFFECCSVRKEHNHRPIWRTHVQTPTIASIACVTETKQKLGFKRNKTGKKSPQLFHPQNDTAITKAQIPKLLPSAKRDFLTHQAYHSKALQRSSKII